MPDDIVGNPQRYKDFSGYDEFVTTKRRRACLRAIQDNSPRNNAHFLGSSPETLRQPSETRSSPPQPSETRSSPPRPSETRSSPLRTSPRWSSPLRTSTLRSPPAYPAVSLSPDMFSSQNDAENLRETPSPPASIRPPSVITPPPHNPGTTYYTTDDDLDWLPCAQGSPPTPTDISSPRPPTPTSRSYWDEFLEELMS